MRGRAGLLALAAVLAAGVLAWYAWSGGEEAAVRARLASLAAEVNAEAGEGLAAVAHAVEIGSYFTDDVLIELGPGTSPIVGRAMLVGMAARLMPRTAAFRLAVDDVGVSLSEDESAADVRLTASFIRRVAADGQPSVDARELGLVMTRSDGTWRIARLTTVETLR